MRGCVSGMTFGRQAGAGAACGQLGAYFGLSRNVRSCGAARSSAEIPVMRRSRSAPGHGSAPVRAAISATVSPWPRLKKMGSVMPLNRGPAGRIRISPRHRSGTAAPGRRVPCSAGTNNRIGADRMASPRSIPRRPRSEHAWRCRRDRAGSSRADPEMTSPVAGTSSGPHNSTASPRRQTPQA